MGNVELDLTRALVGPGTSTIEVVCVMANVEILGSFLPALFFSALFLERPSFGAPF